MNSQFLSLFEGELASLYERASAMASCYPERGLALGAGRLSDADVSMRLLLEGVAYLGARVQQRAERTDYRLAMRMVSVMFPGLLDAVPPKVLAKLDAKQMTRLDERQGEGFECAALPSGEGRGRYALKPEWEMEVQPVKSTALGVRWLGSALGIEVVLTVCMGGEEEPRELHELVLAGLELPGERLSELSKRFAGALLCAGRVYVSSGDVELVGKCEPASWRRAGTSGDVGCDLRLLLENLQWADSGAVIRLVLEHPLLVRGGESMSIRTKFELFGESFAADLRRLTVVVNVAGFANRHITQSDRFEVDSRRLNNFFAPRAFGSEPMVLRAVGAKAFQPKTNKAKSSEEVSFVSGCGHRRIDTKDRWVLVHEPAWVQGDGVGSDGKFSENIFLLPPAKPGDHPPMRLDVAVELEVCAPAIRTAVRQGCTVQAIASGQVAEGSVIGNVEAEVAHPVVREELGSVLRLGTGSFAAIAESQGGDLREFCEQLLSMLAQTSSVVCASWLRGTLAVSATPSAFADNVDGIAVIVRGWVLQIRQSDSFLKSGAGPLIAAEIFRFLRSRCPINSRLALELRDPEGALWMRMNS